ncbi:MAG TPA: hypothetical protein VD993_18945 [Chitinophagaceae bacterium]|nr:hypothetical protein [Chitinophagaceae bacterium]
MQATFTQLTLFDKRQNNFCMVNIYQQQPASADKFSSFKKEWEELVRAAFEVPANVKPQPKKLKNGQTALSYAAQ